MFEIVFDQKMLWNSAQASVLGNFNSLFKDSAPYRMVVKTLVLNSLVLVFVVMFLDSHVLLSIEKSLLAFDINDLIYFLCLAFCHLGSQHSSKSTIYSQIGLMVASIRCRCHHIQPVSVPSS